MFCYAVGLGLRQPYIDIPGVHRVIRMAIALTLLPPNLMMEGFQVISEYNTRTNVDLPQPTSAALQIFLQYIREFWLNRIGPERFSVYNEPRRTNNDMESFHHRLNQAFGGQAHGGFFPFVGKWKQIFAITPLHINLNFTFTRGHPRPVR